MVLIDVLRLKPNLASFTKTGENTCSNSIAVLAGAEWLSCRPLRYCPELASGTLLIALSRLKRTKAVVLSEK